MRGTDIGRKNDGDSICRQRIGGMYCWGIIILNIRMHFI